ncbi:flavin reductase family protein [Amycolatopsis sp. H20-H5]|uniref:flavin reductase family protein n=1 Tax=Amycolatopsis sp. H20-H5 TaxID=3046309 RepID=UPI002DB9B2FE|nr:flavin reductase family protein [Amycolatopsis sp. H20-H5]MEC3976936.1 flavin reductase family protein [Amycolatopsis sp. H20-H5]
MTFGGEPSERPVVTRLNPPPPRRTRLSEQAGLREVMARFATGITVLTAGGEHGHGMTANAFSSVSLEPPMVLCCVSRAARMHAAIEAAGSFAVSILATDQRELARYFADWRRPAGLAQFDPVDWEPGPRTGAPLLGGSLAWLECELSRSYEAGDHSIFLGEVVSSSCGVAQDALVFYGGGYYHFDKQARATA